MTDLPDPPFIGNDDIVPVGADLGPSDEMIRQPLLRAIFEDGLAGSLFIVLRNGEQLPDRMSGTDLDVSVRPGHRVDEVVSFLCQRGASAGWDPVCMSRRPHMVGFSLVYRDPASTQAIHFDVFDGISYLCLPLLTPAVLDTESILRRGVRQLGERGRVAATVIHHLAWSGLLSKAKYRIELERVLADPHDRSWLLGKVERALGHHLCEEVLALRSTDSLGVATGSRRWVLAKGLMRQWLCRDPIVAVKSVLRYLVGQTRSMWRPPGLVGCPGDPIAAALPGKPLSAELACRISPHAFAAPTVRAHAASLRTFNGPRYERSTVRLWRRWGVVRWVWPTLFLWVQAKRNRVVVLEELPLVPRFLRSLSLQPTWIAPARGSRRPPLASGLLAGLLDTGLSSLATFAVGMFAASSFAAAELGTYALVFSAFLVAAMVPTQAVFVPCEVAALQLPRPARLALLARSSVSGAGVALVAAGGMLAWMLMTLLSATTPSVLPLILTAALAAFISPIQDHQRRMLHLADASWLAAVVSAVHLGTVGLLLFAAGRLGLNEPWVPFAALATANLISLTAGVAGAPRRGTDYSADAVNLRLSELLHRGRWLLAVGLLPTTFGFVAAVLIVELSGAEALGHAEAARVLTQPLLVLSTGLSAFMGPRSMEAGRTGDLNRARRVSTPFVALVLLTGIPYLLMLGVPWEWNPLPALVPAAYAVGGLMAVTALAMIVNAVVFPYRSELLGAGRERRLAVLEAAGNFVRAAVACGAGILGAFAAPCGLLALGLIRAAGYLSALRPHYSSLTRTRLSSETSAPVH